MNKTKQLVIDAILLALLIISGKVVIPVGVVGITLQVSIVLLITLLINYKDSLFVIIAYLILGLIFQLPIFTYGGGFTYIYNPSFGFLIGFVISIFIVKLFMKILTINNILIKSFISSLFGILAIYLIALGYGALLYSINENPLNVLELLEIFILPFIIFDIFKAFISSIIYSRIKHLF